MLLFSVKSADCQIEKLSAAGFYLQGARHYSLLLSCWRLAFDSATRSKLYLLRHPIYKRAANPKITSISPPAFCI